MRGEVLHFDEAQGFGFITGADGSRYTFAREDLRRDGPVSKGAAVEFQPNGGQAKSVFLMRTHAGTEPAAGAVPPGAPAHFGRNAVPAAPAAAANTSLWGYFRGCLTTNYANFSGRARRKEYWGYYLFWIIGLVVVGGAGFAVDAATGGLNPNGYGPIAVIVACGLWYLGALIPFLALTVRRHHDVGLSGWFVLLFVALSLVYVGGIILFVISLIPSQQHDNKWGPVPDGIAPRAA